MLEQVLRHLNNWFLVDTHEGTFTVENGSIALPFLQTNQYFRICGSVFNDGLHLYPAVDLTDEIFTGTVWALAIPKAVVTLSIDIAAWEEKNGEAVLSPYTSESFGGYSYTKASGGKADTSAVTGWQDAFKGRLNDWRKLKGVEP
jgi:hypothetical protein|nr:MAG TPA: Protein of unknown function (DUF3199) [Caudoviricetes sp.]DAV43502.1 MAG TPA: Protein of unknown function (DUF3199) [Caudoviricetes sp.]